jgi:hypothetical protein
MFTMRTSTNKSEAEPVPSKPANTKPPDITSASVPDTLSGLLVTPETGLTHAEVDTRHAAIRAVAGAGFAMAVTVG